MPFDQTLFGLYSLNFFTNAANSILAPFYPDVAINKGIGTDIIGYVFAAHPIFSFLFSLLMGKMMNIWGRKKILVLGLLFQSIGLATFGAVIHIEEKIAFILISALARIIQGIGFACYGSVAYGYLPLLYPDSVEKKISYMEILTGVGLMLGPLIGGLLYSLGGYECPFYFMAGFFFLITPVMLGRLPRDVKEGKKDKLLNEENPKPLSVAKFFFNKRMFMTFLIVVIPNSAFGILQPTFTNHMHQYTDNTMVISIMFSIGTFAYALSMPMMACLPKRLDRRLWLMTGLILNSLSGFLLGPEPLLNFPHNIAFVIIGISLLGVGCAFSMVPSIPEFMDIGIKIYPSEKVAVGDMSSGLFNSAYSAGALIGPIVGGYLDSFFGFPRAETFLGLFIFAYFLLYLTVGEAFTAFGSFVKKPTDKVRLLEDEEEKEHDNDSGHKEDNGTYIAPEEEKVKPSFDVTPAETGCTDISPNMVSISADNRTTIMMSPETQKLDMDSKIMGGDQYNTIVEKDEEGEMK